jgi:hypothetical protein
MKNLNIKELYDQLKEKEDQLDPKLKLLLLNLEKLAIESSQNNE